MLHVYIVEHSHGDDVIVQAGKGLMLPKGERVRWKFSEDAEYVPICLPGFSPSNCHREEVSSSGEDLQITPEHDKHFYIYHLVQVPLWENCKKESATYYPPTYEADGFTHATANPAKLLEVANHFYLDVKSDWLCLKMSRSSLANQKIVVKFESPSPVGSTPALNSEQSGGERFPHIYAGIPAFGDVVLEEFPVIRDNESGKFLAIPALNVSC